MSRRRRLEPRRRAGRPDGRHLRGVLASAVVLTLSAAAVLLADGAPPAPPGSTVGAGNLLTRATIACPGAPKSNGVATRFAIGSAPLPGLSGIGRMEQDALGQQPRSFGLLRGRVRALAGSAQQGIVVRADKAAAPGLFGARVDSGRKTLSVVSCTAPRSTWWFTGAGATLDHRSTLMIANVDPGPAVVDIHVFGPDGELPTAGMEGKTIASGTRSAIRLGDVVPQGDRLTVSVVAHRGRVSAGMADSFAGTVGVTPGRDWLPSQDGASRVLRFAGMPERADRRTLLVGNPSEREATVRVEVAGSSGTFTAVGLDEIRVPAGTVVSTDVTKSLRQVRGALRLHAQVRVVAGLRSVLDGDTAYTPVTTPIGAQAAVALPRRTSASVSLTSGGLPGAARITLYAADGAVVKRHLVDVPARATVTWPAGERGAYLVAETMAGSLHGAVTFVGAGTSQVPLLHLPVRRAQVRVRPAP